MDYKYLVYRQHKYQSTYTISVKVIDLCDEFIVFLQEIVHSFEWDAKDAKQNQ